MVREQNQTRPVRALPRASVLDTARVIGRVGIPLLQRGVIVRRPSQTRLMERVDADRHAVALLQELRQKYGAGPLRLRMPGRRMVLVLSPDHVQRILDETPEPFHTATREKRAALAHFEPAGVLISSTEDRPERRRFNESALDTDHAIHRGADAMIGAINDEVDRLLADRDVLTWPDYSRHWMRMVRRIVFGEQAADDEQLTDDMLALRSSANWAFLHPTRRRVRERMLAGIDHYLANPEPGSLSEYAARAPQTPTTFPEHQVPQWLFAFDAASWASWRALALLGSHERQAGDALRSLEGLDLRRPHPLPVMRACVLESLRLWPTTPAILRETTRRVRFEGGPVPEDTAILNYAPLFHRDDENLDAAHRFEPEMWEDERAAMEWPLVPFSAGPAVCPARNLVLHVTSTVISRIFSERRPTLLDDRLDPSEPLPGTLDPFSLRFALTDH